jgi:hypothetical protein
MSAFIVPGREKFTPCYEKNPSILALHDHLLKHSRKPSEKDLDKREPSRLKDKTDVRCDWRAGKIEQFKGTRTSTGPKTLPSGRGRLFSPE